MAALPIHSSCFTNKPHNHLLQFHPKPKLSIRSETPSNSNSTSTSTSTSTNNTSPTNEPKNPNSPGLGFGSSSSSSSSLSSTSNKPNSSTDGGNEKRRGGRKDRVIRRRTPLKKPGFVSEQQVGNQPTKEQSRNESAFVLTWLGLGAVILVEGIALAASGFLPEEWDKLFVKYLYPSFTPTVGLFVAGSVVYGVLKYLQNEELKGQK